MTIYVFLLSLLGGFSVAIVAILVTKIILAYIRLIRLYFKMRAIPEPPCPFWQRFTLGHKLINVIVRLPREQSGEQIQQWSRKHGSVFQVRALFGQPSVMITSLEAFRHITSACSSSKYRKGPLFRNNLIALIGEKSMFFEEGLAHSRLRRIIAPAFRYSSLLTLHRVFVRHAHALADTLLDQPKDIFEAVQYRSFAVILDACFGDKTVSPVVFHKLQKDYFTAIQEPADFMMRRIILQYLFNFVSPSWFGFQERVKLAIRKTVTNLVRMVNVMQKVPQDSGSSNSTILPNSPNLLALVADAERRQVLEEQEATSLVLSFLAAGQLTTAFAISWLLYNLATHPQWQERVREEVSSWNSESEDALQVVDDFPILDRVVKETLRYDPPIMLSARETVEADVIEGYNIPKGITVRVPIFAIQRDPDIWGPDANTFNPDRWLHKDIQNLAPSLLVFWNGIRNCIGQRFAVLEIKTFTAAIIKRASVSTRKEDPKPAAKGPFAYPLNMRIYLEPLPRRT